MNARLLILICGFVVIGSQPASAQYVLNGYMVGTAERPQFKNELRLDPEQLDAVKKATQIARKNILTPSQEFNLPIEERVKATKKRRREVADAFEKDLRATLKEEQMTRLRQITIQMVKGDAFADKDVRDGLKLTDQQIAKVDGFLKDKQKRVPAIAGLMGNPKTREEAMTRAKEVDRELLMSILSVLSADQKAKWEKMRGEPVPGLQDNGP